VIVLLEKPDVRFDPPPIGLAIATAKNKLLEHYRKGPTYPPPADDAVIDPAGSALQGLLETADREEKVRRLEAVLQKLGSPCREITRWKMEGAKAMEIADRLKMGVNAVEVQAHRCLRRIQTLLVELKSGSRV
jgi:DNA-directed RNA polymerase specialized sigma24 family protein